MAIVNTAVPITSQSCQEMIRQLVDTYSDMRTEILGRTAFQRPISSLVLGSGERQVLYSAAHHANEWITSLVLLKYAEEALVELKSLTERLDELKSELNASSDMCIMYERGDVQ